ncbi:ECF transporter S component [Clostridium fallax]|uniref:Uncharacterized membrane protein n=1 Tax=Clostridium fallax TaxID=1533 RepID=A0A1M4SX65_9CLOT|nr:ECF transporter S component [Clostridium fallax]SHE36812.1 Uncharacterized membrane protein [Clostridium fallax]SQB08014.1 membrane spanning protein [Clostridium fallax]
MERNESYSLLNWILTALMIALVFLAGNVIKIPTIGGFVHVGDCMVLLSAVLLGKKRGALAAAVGMALVDIYGGYFLWAPFTFIIKGVMAYIAGDILEKFKEKTFKTYLISFITAGVFMVIGYLFAGALMASLLTGKVNGITAALVYAAKDIPGNIIQVVTGIVIALPLANVMLRARKKVFN